MKQNPYGTPSWRKIRAKVLERDESKCRECGAVCSSPELDVHHLVPRSLGGPDELSNLVTLCDGCHAGHHPNLQASLSRRFLERWACRLIGWLDRTKSLPEGFEQLGAVLRLLGMKRFREGQLDVVLAALRGDSVLFVSPTGSGKTLCFQVPALLRPGLACVVSPLKALMSDQMVRNQRLKIPSTFINSDLNFSERASRWELIQSAAVKFFYFAPERFDPEMVGKREATRMLDLRPSYLVVDEAHCIVSWGNDFRPNYGRLGLVRKKMEKPPTLAFTASAGVRTQNAIKESLHASDAKVVLIGIDRPNIGMVRIKVSGPKEKYQVIHDLLSIRHDGKSMLFVPSLKIGYRLQKQLQELSGKEPVPFYHSQIESVVERDAILGRFMDRLKPTLKEVICTNAFGMGLDIPNVRLVIHWQPPESAEAYLQEFERGGRDGKPSLAVVLCDKNPDARERKLLYFMADRSTGGDGQRDEVQEAAFRERLNSIDEMFEMATPRSGCFRKRLRTYFEGHEDRVSKGIIQWLLEWLFAEKIKKVKRGVCCDYCNGISKHNIVEKTKNLFQ